MITEYQLIKKDFTYFVENYVKIQHPTKEIMSLNLKGKQYDLANKLQHSPNHMMALVARQIGSTSLAAAYLVWYSILNPDKVIVTVNSNMVAGHELLTRIRSIISMLPQGLQLQLLKNTKSEIIFDNGTRIRSLSYNNFITGSKGYTISMLYVDHLHNVKSELIDYMIELMSTLSGRLLINTNAITECLALWKYAQSCDDFTTTTITYNDVYDEYNLSWIKQSISEDQFKTEYECKFCVETGR